MAEEFSLGTLDERICAAAIQEAIHKAQGTPKENGRNGLDSMVYPKSAMENPMMDHFKALLENGEDSDVLVRCRDAEFRAHKVILSARSTVLKAMLKDPQVKESGVLLLSDLPAEVMRVVLFYIHTGSLPLSRAGEIHTQIEEMIKASDVLAMSRLKYYLQKFVR